MSLMTTFVLKLIFIGALVSAAPPKKKLKVTPKSTGYSLDPKDKGMCNDFFASVCSTQNMKMNQSKNAIFIPHEVQQEKIYEQLMAALSESPPTNPSHEILPQAHHLYQACTNEQKREDHSITQIIDQLAKLKEISFKKDPTKWMIVAYPNTGFYKLTIETKTLQKPRINNSGKKVIDPVNYTSYSIGYSAFSLNTTFPNAPMEDYVHFMRGILEQFIQDDKSNALFKKPIQQNMESEIPRRIINYFTVLHGLSDAGKDVRNYNMKLGLKLRLNNMKLGNIDWARFFKAITDTGNYISGKLSSMVVSEESYKKLDDYIANLDEEVARDFLEWSIILSYVYPLEEFKGSPPIHLDKRYAEIRRKTLDTPMTNANPDIKTASPKQMCLNTVIEFYPQALDRIYFDYMKRQNLYSDAIHKEIEGVLKSLKVEMGKLLDKSNLVGVVRDQAKAKVEGVRLVTGHTDLPFDNDKMDRMYAYHSIKSGMTYLEMLNHLMSLTPMYKDHFLREQGQDYLETYRSFHLHASYTENIVGEIKVSEIIVPAGVLQFFLNKNKTLDLILTEAAFTLGHELAHSIDGLEPIFFFAMHLDRLKYNDIQKTDDWKKSFKHVISAQKCFVDLYGNQTEKGEKVNGHSSLKENTADSVGFQVAAALLEQKFGDKFKRIQNPWSLYLRSCNTSP